MKFGSIVGGGLACAIALSGLNYAYTQERQRSGSQTTVRSERTERTRTSTEVRRISTVVGGKFVVQGGASFGKIEDIVINDSGCIDYVILVHDDMYFPIPWTIVNVDFDSHVIAVDITRERLLEGPSFSGWAEFSKTEWREKVTEHYRSERRERSRDDRDSDRSDSSKGKRDSREGRTDRKTDQGKTDQGKTDQNKTDRGNDRDEKRDKVEKPGESKEKPSTKKQDEKKAGDKEKPQ